MDPEAKAHLDRALERYAAGDYQAAIEAFKRGYMIDPRREFLFAWAQSERLAGDCVTASELYTRFLDEGPSDAQIAAAEHNLGLCEQAIAEARQAPAPAPEPAPAPAAPAPAPAPAPEPEPVREARPWFLDPVGDGLVGGGLAVALIGGGLLTVAAVKERRLADAPTYGDFAAQVDDVHRASRSLRIGGGVALGVGVGLLVGGVVRWARVARAGPPARRRAAAGGRLTLTPALAPRGVGVGLGGRF